MSFLESPRFPDSISYGSSGGPSYRTTVCALSSGHEQRNQGWRYARHRYDAAFGVRRLEDMEALLAFFHVAAGRLRAFRYKDWADFRSCSARSALRPTDQSLGVGDGFTVSFGLRKGYVIGGEIRWRPVAKPVAGSVRVALNGVEQTAGWTVDHILGLVTFAAAPAEGMAVTAGFEFDVPVRFDTDELSTRFEAYQSLSAAVPLIEVRA